MILTLCGSAKFEPWFQAWDEALSLSGHLVLSHPAGNKSDRTPEDETFIEALYKKKIDLSDALIVLNAFAYIGPGAMGKILYAKEVGKEIYALESWGLGLGIDGGHAKSVRDAAERFGVPKMFGSPIDTSKWPDLWRLLPDAGSRRSHIVTLLEKKLQPLGRSL